MAFRPDQPILFKKSSSKSVIVSAWRRSFFMALTSASRWAFLAVVASSAAAPGGRGFVAGRGIAGRQLRQVRRPRRPGRRHGQIRKRRRIGRQPRDHLLGQGHNCRFVAWKLGHPSNFLMYGTSFGGFVDLQRRIAGLHHRIVSLHRSIASLHHRNADQHHGIAGLHRYDVDLQYLNVSLHRGIAHEQCCIASNILAS